MNNERPIFISGCPRSGTSLLASLLETRFDLAVPVEPHFVSYFRLFRFLWGDLNKTQNRERLFDAIQDFLAVWVPRNNAGQDPARVLPSSLIVTRPTREDAVRSFQSFPELIKELFTRFAQHHGKSGWVDKSVYFNPMQPPDPKKGMEDMRVIHIVRDGRDVVSSWMKVWFAPGSFAEAVLLWQRHIRAYHRWGQAHPGNYLEIKYEDLLRHTENTMEKISYFLDLKQIEDPSEISESMLARTLAPYEIHTLLKGGVAGDNLDKWRNGMPTHQIRLFEALAGDCLKETGYDLAGEPPHPMQTIILSLQGRVLWCGRYVRPQFYLRGCKRLLPLVIFVAQRLGVSLPGMLNRRLSGWAQGSLPENRPPA